MNAELPHMADGRRSVGTLRRSGQKVFQVPVICAADIVEEPFHPWRQRRRVATLDPNAVRCADCRARIDG